MRISVPILGSARPVSIMLMCLRSSSAISATVSCVIPRVAGLVYVPNEGSAGGHIGLRTT